MSESVPSPGTSSAIRDEDDEVDGSAITWHRILSGERNGGDGGGGSFFGKVAEDDGSAPESLLSDTTETAGEHEEDLLNALRIDGSINYDSGNFSFSESSKGKAVAESPGGHQDLAHERFVQLNTELYQAKTELLTYKYKWNEIRNEVELEWNKKLRQVVDEKVALQREVESLQEQMRMFVEGSGLKEESLEILKLRSELDQARIQVDCKDRANVILKEKIAEQYCDRENLSLELRKQEKILLEMRNELSSAKGSEEWFRNELHTCQNVNAKLRESSLLLENRLSLEKANSDRLRVELQQVIRNAEDIERRAIKEKNDLLEKLSAIETSNKLETIPNLIQEETSIKLKEASEQIILLTDSNQNYEQEKIHLQSNLTALAANLSTREALIDAYRNKESETLTRIASLEADIARLAADRQQAQQQNTELHLAIARQNFTNRDLDVSVGHLRAQLQVLSINFENTRRALGVKEFTVEKLDQDFRELHQRYTEVERCRAELREAARMSEVQARDRYEQLLDNFRKIQSKNLDLELKLGQCVEHNEKFRRSEQVVQQLKKDITELQERLERDASVGSDKMTSSSGSSSGEGSDCSSGSSRSSAEKQVESTEEGATCPKHGNAIPEDDTRELKILLKAIESEHRQKLKRYELNNRTLLKKVKEHERAKRLAEQKVEALEKDVDRMASMDCELARMREKTMLLEVDLGATTEERDALNEEKLRLTMALHNSCLVQADEDIWASFQRIFADLRDKEHVHKENLRLKELLRIGDAKILRLEEELKQSLSSSEEKNTVIENLKLAGEIQRVECDEVRSELTVQSIQLEDTQKTVARLSCERDSLQDSIGSQQQAEARLREQVEDLLKILEVREVQLETAYERLKLYEESERILSESRQQFFDDIQTLRDEIIAEKQEKQELQDVVRALKENMAQAVECNLKNFQATSQTDSAVPSLASSNGNEELPVPPKSPPSGPRFNEDALKALLEQCNSRRGSSTRPLQECVASLRSEMQNLNAVVRQNGQQRYHVVSLMEELQDATNGTYNSR